MKPKHIAVIVILFVLMLPARKLLVPVAVVPQDWRTALLHDIGNDAPTQDTLNFLEAWRRAEGASEDCHNWFNTTQENGNASSINSVGVKCYANDEQGRQATIDTLTQNYPGYAEILNGLQNNDVNRARNGLASSPWGTSIVTLDQLLGEHITIASAAGTFNRADPVPDWQNHINVGFYAVNCEAWGFQSGCQHFGTDIGGNGEGTPVFAPYSGTVIECTDNGDTGPYIGKWIEYRVSEDTVFLINHFRDIYKCNAGDSIQAGEQLGTMREDANHVHIQVTENGQLVDFEDYWKRH